MARFGGNIFSKAHGSIGGITFSEARNRRGKIQTGRERVAPSNPRTVPQQVARDNMADTQDIIQRIDSFIYRDWMDRSVGKLPGAQSLASRLQAMKSVVGTDIVANVEPPNLELGGIQARRPTVLQENTLFEYFVQWNPQPSGNQLASDIPVVIGFQRVFPRSAVGARPAQIVWYDPGPIGPVNRASGGVQILFDAEPGSDDGVALVFFFTRAPGVEPFDMTPAEFIIFNPN